MRMNQLSWHFEPGSQFLYISVKNCESIDCDRFSLHRKNSQFKNFSLIFRNKCLKTCKERL